MSEFNWNGNREKMNEIYDFLLNEACTDIKCRKTFILLLNAY